MPGGGVLLGSFPFARGLPRLRSFDLDSPPASAAATSGGSEMRSNIITEVRFRFSVSVVARLFFFPEVYLDLRRISVKSLRKWVSNPLVSEERSRGGARLRMRNGKLVNWQESSRFAGGLGVIFRRRCHGRVCEGAGRVN